MTSNNSLKKILVLDDVADLRKLLIHYLGKMFAGVSLEEYDPVARGAPADDFDWSAYDVLILDYDLSIPGVTGLDILHKNRKNPDFPACIMLTGAGNEEIAVRALKAGVYDYLRKQKLGKEALKESITGAFARHQKERHRQSELTQQGNAFNKSVFYQQLEYKKSDPEYRQRTLLLIDLDDHDALEKRVGLVLRDNIIRHIAKESYQLFKSGNFNPGITRIGDYSIALLIDTPSSLDALENILGGLISHLGKHPYSFNAQTLPCTVHIGAIHLPEEGSTADTIIRLAKTACDTARRGENTIFHIHARDIEKTSATAAVGMDKPPQSKGAYKPATPPPAHPKKSLAELKAGITKQNIPADAGSALPTAGETDSQDSTETGFDDAGLDLKQAFDEKRVIQVFQPLISLLNEDADGSEETHYVSLQYVDRNGSVMDADEISSQVTTPDLKKYIDRWILREIIGKLTNTSRENYTFVIDISDASLADATFFTWLRKLLLGLDSRSPGEHIAMEIDIKDVVALEKQTSALINYLRKNHNIRFVLGGITRPGEIVQFAGKIHFDFVRGDHQLLTEILQDTSPESSALEMMNSAGTRFIADNIGDATVLTEVISAGIEYAMGDFIGEPVPQLEDMANIESFEIA